MDLTISKFLKAAAINFPSMCDCYEGEFEMAEEPEEEKVPVLVVAPPRKRLTRT